MTAAVPAIFAAHVKTAVHEKAAVRVTVVARGRVAARGRVVFHGIIVVHGTHAGHLSWSFADCNVKSIILHRTKENGTLLSRLCFSHNQIKN